ncbi:MAG TPA: amidohydrolase family protein [Actinomycetes bacterium]|nr:amidohydrolase family protein [Actinomycetes bacterium]
MTTLLLRDGHVLSPGRPDASAVLLADDRVAWVGSDPLPDADEVVDLAGCLVTPAFVDAHVHATATGLALDGLDLTATHSLAEALDAVATYVRGSRAAVVLGHGWDESRWPDGQAPTRTEVDRAAGGRPSYLARIDVHSAAASSALRALVPQLARLDGYDPDGPLTREAHHAVRAAALAAVTESQRSAAQRTTLDRAASLGIASVHECAGPRISGVDDLTALLELAASSPGPAVTGYWGELASSGGVVRALSVGARGAAGDLFVDGALGSHTAWLREPYADADGTGAAYVSVEEIAEHVVACTRAGLQAGFHAIGDAALAAVTEGLESAAAVVGVPALRAARHRVEHAEMLDAGLVTRLAALGVVASVQPVFDELWGGDAGMYATRLGPQRAAELNPFATMDGAGLALALGSDAPVTPLGGWEAVRAAVHHRSPQHRIDVDRAFAAHTVGGWYAAGVDDAGVLEPGRQAHLAVWDVTEPGLPALDAGSPIPLCLRTIVAGRTVWKDR